MTILWTTGVQRDTCDKRGGADAEVLLKALASVPSDNPGRDLRFAPPDVERQGLGAYDARPLDFRYG
jgi:hypothetical protein